MSFIAHTREAIEDLGLLKGLWELVSSPVKRYWRKIVNSPKIPDYGYFVRYRKISSRYRTRTSGIVIHEIEIEATRNNVSHYQGRYLRRPKSILAVNLPHKEPQLTEVDNQFQKFTIELQEILSKGKTTKIVMEVSWEDESHRLHPQSVFTPLCETGSLEFVVIVPEHEIITGAKGTISQHPGMHVWMSKNKISVNDGVLTWIPPYPEILLAYKVTWEWSRNS